MKNSCDWREAQFEVMAIQGMFITGHYAFKNKEDAKAAVDLLVLDTHNTQAAVFKLLPVKNRRTDNLIYQKHSSDIIRKRLKK